MTGAHLHLLVNHFPIVGTILVLPLLLLALWRGGRGLLLGAGVLLAISGVFAGIANATGEEAEEAVEELPGVTHALIHDHEENAEVALVLTILAGVAGVGATIRALRGEKEPGRAWSVGLLVPTVLAAGAMALTGASGGKIRRPELQDPNAALVTGGERGEHGERGEADERGER